MKLNQFRGFDSTHFNIEITDSENRTFYGWINDDIASGGMPGRGSIRGTQKENEISFIKFMPYYVSYSKEKNTSKYKQEIDKTRLHPPIYYTGKQTSVDTYEGRWNFDYSFILLLLFWFKGIKTGGTWKMTKITE